MIITKEMIDEIFNAEENASAPHQVEAFLAVYRLVLPDLDEIQIVEGWPSAGSALNDYLFRKFMHFDRKYHPNVLPGGLWMNKGFSEDKSLGEWEVSTKNTIIRYE